MILLFTDSSIASLEIQFCAEQWQVTFLYYYYYFNRLYSVPGFLTLSKTVSIHICFRCNSFSLSYSDILRQIQREVQHRLQVSRIKSPSDLLLQVLQHRSTYRSTSSIRRNYCADSHYVKVVDSGLRKCTCCSFPVRIHLLIYNPVKIS